MEELKSGLSQNGLTGDLSLQLSSFRLGKKLMKIKSIHLLYYMHLNEIV